MGGVIDPSRIQSIGPIFEQHLCILLLDPNYTQESLGETE